MRVLNVKDQAVTRGVLDKDVKAFEHLIEITFVDFLGTPHTLHVHKNGPFTKPTDAIAAFYDGTIHDHEGEPAEPETPPPPAGLAEQNNQPVGG